MSAALDPPDRSWIGLLQARADRPPARPREPLRCGAHPAPIGSIEAALAARIEEAGLPLECIDGGWRIAGAADASLERIARWLHANGLCSRWRGELLAVVSGADETPLGRVERAAARALGLTTHAVHLAGWTEDGDAWIQQRAFDKATDPGRWDTLVGGMVAAGESIDATLLRETREEAGLAIDALRGLDRRGRITIRRPVDDGYMVEHIDVFEAVVPWPLVPENRDGEVARFECVAAGPLVERLRAGEFTLEAALILVASLQRSGGLPRA